MWFSQGLVLGGGAHASRGRGCAPASEGCWQVSGSLNVGTICLGSCIPVLVSPEPVEAWALRSLLRGRSESPSRADPGGLQGVSGSYSQLVLLSAATAAVASPLFLWLLCCLAKLHSFLPLVSVLLGYVLETSNWCSRFRNVSCICSVLSIIQFSVFLFWTMNYLLFINIHTCLSMITFNHTDLLYCC